MVDLWDQRWQGISVGSALTLGALLWLRLLPLFVVTPWLLARASAGVGAWLSSVVAASVLLPWLLAAGVPTVPTSFAAVLTAGAVELLRGAVLACGCALPLWTFEVSGALADTLRGGGQPLVEPLLAGLYVRASVVVALAASAHIGLVRWFAEGLSAVPLGSGLHDGTQLGALLMDLAGLLMRAVVFGIALAAPVLIGSWLAHVLAGLLSRVAAGFVPSLGAALAPMLVLGLVCVSVSSVFDQVPALLRFFSREAVRLLGMLS